MWHCPHCGVPQAETARCWVCHRSSTTCSTCRHFRTSLAADVGWCAFDPKRLPLTGLEQRGCWQERQHAELGAGPVGEEPHGRAAWVPNHDGVELMPDARVPARDFVPVELLAPSMASRQVAAGGEDGAEPPVVRLVRPIEAEIAPAVADRTSLFGDLEAY
jgi:hypothetical protein